MPVAWYWIVLIMLAALLLLLCRTKVGALAEFGPDGLKLDAKVGFFSIHILPQKKKEKKEEKPKKKKKMTTPTEEEAAGAEEKKAKIKMPKITLEDIKDAIRTLWPPLKRALNRTRRGIRIHPLQLSVTVGAENDPASGAKTYGYLHGGVWTGMPVLEKLLVIPDPHIHVGIDFDSPKTVAEGTVGISIRIGTLLMVAIGVGIPALRWFLRFQKKQKQLQNQQTPKSGEPRDNAAA